LIITDQLQIALINAMLTQYKKTSSRFAFMGGIIGGKLVTNRRTNEERTTANERSVCCALPKNFNNRYCIGDTKYLFTKNS